MADCESCARGAPWGIVSDRGECGLRLPPWVTTLPPRTTRHGDSCSFWTAKEDDRAV